ncbi:MAG: Tetraprenyl-beta-curcumene synthase [Syntrophus sp. PtaU1.Bin208]|nr:MAG: Tetraprenyl-beta-curcumene synthase [Syntrophus sp. PtaU1.Bin208]
MKIPTHLTTLTTRIFLQVRPRVQCYLKGWRRRAEAIPDPELRRQALLSIRTKTFHCEGGAVYALLAGPHFDETVRFIIAYQTISDYLDNLCDRSTSLDPADFRTLHASMLHALTPSAPLDNYYALHQEQNDGGYLAALVRTCQEILGKLPTYPLIAPALYELAGHYRELQVHKHVRKDQRIRRLEKMFLDHPDYLSQMTWYEFSACAGSTLGIFCLIASAFQRDFDEDLSRRIQRAYFPWVQGLHILLDYLIDQEEDLHGGDLNFCSFYPDAKELEERLKHFYNRADQSIAHLPYAPFHRLINRGLLGIYLADRKVFQQKEVRQIARRLIGQGGATAFFFFSHCRLYRWISEKDASRPPSG